MAKRLKKIDHLLLMTQRPVCDSGSFYNTIADSVKNTTQVFQDKLILFLNFPYMITIGSDMINVLRTSKHVAHVSLVFIFLPAFQNCTVTIATHKECHRKIKPSLHFKVQRTMLFAALPGDFHCQRLT